MPDVAVSEEKLDEAALDYHRHPKPGKLEIQPTKKMVNQRDLSLAYSPGVAAACRAIAADPAQAAALTARANLVAVISNGTAVLGLGDIGPLAAKPVMEGKAVLFKKFADIDVFDLEIAETDVERFVDIVCALEPTFGGINLEDIKAPECFEIERRLRERLRIPVFHDDQHGTAICVGAAVRNGLRLLGKRLDEIRLVCSGAGAAALACLDLLVEMGLDPAKVRVFDRGGLVHKARAGLDPYRARWAVDGPAVGLDEALRGADVFLGLSGPGVLRAEHVAAMADPPLILALANPVPEILPEEALAGNPNAIIATGRSDYPNQVNNVLCFPFLFRGALDVGATTINTAMKLACVEALADLALSEPADSVAVAYGGKRFRFGRDYLIPKPFDTRLMTTLPPRVARAAMDSGVATRPIEDFAAYQRRLEHFIYRSTMVMRPVFERAAAAPRRIVYVDGESRRVLRAAQVAVDDGLCRPILVGRRAVIAALLEDLGLRLRMDEDFDVLELADNPDFERDWRLLHALNRRRGITPDDAKTLVLTHPTVAAALKVRQGDADGLLCGLAGRFDEHLAKLRAVFDLRRSASGCSTVSLISLKSGNFFIADTHVTYDPSAEHLAETARLAADIVRRFGLKPKVAFLSHSSFGSSEHPQAEKMRRARALLQQRAPEIETEGEMQADAAVDEAIRRRIFPEAELEGAANLLMMPNLDAANIAYNLLKTVDEGVVIGPILVGLNRPAHILTPSATVRGIVNMTAVCVVHALDVEQEAKLQ
ncbi:MAG: malate dehydrogenase [Gammaproteobacteria bacterium]|nr:MAG: malate dehydrogenase [Gammaproteobacteria bacterium]